MIRTAIFLLAVHLAVAQTPQVPHKVNFAGITLTIRDDARKEIQKDVDALTQYPKYFNIKVERARTYFPIIEKIFQEERLPDDFKFLVLQESALISDAVSVSNAVGFWQFKDFTAMEMGLRVDHEIDERMNIVASTRAAAQYIKKNNHYFNNWVYALQAYQMGAGGVMRSINDYESGSKHMVITSQTYWYVKKFLAHKIAFEDAVKGPGAMNIISFENQGKKSLHELAKEFAVPREQMEEYNKWVRKGTIPDDRKYAVAIPVEGDTRSVYAAVARLSEEPEAGKEKENKKRTTTTASYVETNIKYLHGLPAIRAEANESASSLAARAGLGLSKFLRYNDISISDRIIEGEYYYLKRKHSKASVATHVVAVSSENLWAISQQYGIQLKKLRKMNPDLVTARLSPGAQVTLVPTGILQLGLLADREEEPEIIEIDKDDFFNWSITPERSEILVSAASNSAPLVQERVPTEATLVSENMPSTTMIPASSTGQHRVLPGETLYGIARTYNCGVMDLVNWNGLKLEDPLKPGQLLHVKAPVATPATSGGYTVHEVKSTDTLYSVARQYGVTIKDLMEWNKKKDFSVTTGEKLRIHQK